MHQFKTIQNNQTLQANNEMNQQFFTNQTVSIDRGSPNNVINQHGNGHYDQSLVFNSNNNQTATSIAFPLTSGGASNHNNTTLLTTPHQRPYRRKVPASTRHSSFSTVNEAVSFFRADVQPLSANTQKKQFFTLQKKLVSSELDRIMTDKREILHRSVQLFFKIHFLADKRTRKV